MYDELVKQVNATDKSNYKDKGKIPSIIGFVPTTALTAVTMITK